MTRRGRSPLEPHRFGCSCGCTHTYSVPAVQQLCSDVLYTPLALRARIVLPPPAPNQLVATLLRAFSTRGVRDLTCFFGFPPKPVFNPINCNTVPRNTKHPVHEKTAGSSGPPDVTLEERSASQSKGPDRTGIEPTTHPAPPKGSTNEPAGRGLPAPTAASSAPTPRVELPHSKQTTAAALVAPSAVTQSTPTATVPPRAASRSRSPPRPPPPTTVRGSTTPPPPCVAAPSPPAPPAYLAAGVLPFCVLGGDLLFLLGQQLRFRSRVRGRSFPEMGGRSTTPVAAEDEGRVASAAARQLPPSIVSLLEMSGT